MNRQTDRHRRLLLLAAPLLASMVGLTPAFAAQGRPQTEPGAVPAAPSCELVAVGSGKPGGDIRYKLHLGGFPAKQAVRVDGPKASFRATVNGKGELDRQGVTHGAYRVTFKARGAQQDVRVTCAAPPADEQGSGKQSVKVGKVEVVVLTPPGTVIDCAKPTTAEFDGKITATGPGKVRFHWTFAGGSKPVSPGSADFPAGTTTQALLHVADVPARPNASTVTVFATLHLPDQKMSARSGPVTFTCEKK
ncbi:hypothetical protein ACFV0H_20500 [Streptomyces erythrochromogenes]|uniref:Ig-like domain-containing protein n=1 Tax=Streptomyces erythrochromogenes TaxID=285574 RepID=A0ABZ1QKY8_9ACTN|nr:hypothetical protein [Streptomyces erythrochromogenes]MCX5589253.1 hypothetical protein [Streptomyces erythrochromogenes]